MIGFYKHENGGHTWVLEVTGEKNKEYVYGVQYIKTGKCGTPYDTFKSEIQIGELPEDKWDYPHWLKITKEEAEAIVGNLAEQQAELAYRNTDDVKTWAKELSAALDEIPGLSVYAYNGVVRIDTPRGGEYTISKGKDGKLHTERTGYPDPDWD